MEDIEVENMENELFFDTSHEQLVRWKHAVIGDYIPKFKVGKFPSLHISAWMNNGATVRHATLKKCDCPDFQKTKKPCTHMYKLALEAGIYEPLFIEQVTWKQRIKNLSDKAFKIFAEEIYAGYYSEIHKAKIPQKYLEELERENLAEKQEQGFQFTEDVKREIISVIYYTFSDTRYKR